MKVSVSKVYSGVFSALIILFCVFYLNSSLELRALTIISCSIVGIMGVMLYKCVKLSGGFIYYVCVVVMHVGQILMVALKCKFPLILKSSIAIGEEYLYSKEAIIYTTWACLIIAIVSILLEKNKEVYEDIETFEGYIGISKLGWILVIAIILLSSISDIVKAAQVKAVGYALGYHQNITLLYYADLLFPLFIFCIIATYRNNERYMHFVFWGIIIKSAFSAVFIGSRGDAVLNIVMSVYAIHKLSSNSNVKKYIIKYFMFIVFAGLVVLPFTGLLRGNSSITLSEFFNEYNSITYSLTEFGGTIVNVRLAAANVQALPSRHFLYSLLSILPLSTVFFPTLTSSYGGNYAAYLNTRGGIGLGGSVIGEGLFWFGKIGGLVYITVIVLIAIFAVNATKKSNNRRQIEINIVALYLLHCIFSQIRGTISDTLVGVKFAIYFLIIFKLVGHHFFQLKRNN